MMKKIFMTLIISSFFSQISAQEKLTSYYTPCVFQENTFHLCEGLPASLRFYGTGKNSFFKDKSASLRLELPSFVTLLASAYTWNRKNVNGKNIAVSDLFKTEKITRDGQPYIRYTISLSKEFSTAIKERNLEFEGQFFYLEAMPGSQGSKAKMYSTLTAGGISEAEKTIILQVLPPLKTSQKIPQKFSLFIAYLTSAYVAPADSELQKSFLDRWKSFTKGPLMSMPHNVLSPIIPGGGYEEIAGLSTAFSMPCFSGNAFFLDVRRGKYKEKYPCIDTANFFGHMSLSPAWMKEDPEKVFEKNVREGIRSYAKIYPGIQYIFWNIEPLISQVGDYDRVHFSKFIGVSTPLSQDEIQKKHFEKWRQYRFDVTRDIIIKVTKLFKEERPDLSIFICGAGLFARYPDLRDPTCATDPRNFDAFVDGHIPMLYSAGTGFYDNVLVTRKGVRKNLIALNDPNEVIESFYKIYTSDRILQNILASASLHADGYGLWPHDNFDHRYIQAVANGYAMVGDAEEIYTQGEDVTSKSFTDPMNYVSLELPQTDGQKRMVKIPELTPDIRFNVHKYGNRYAATLFNYNEKQEIYLKLTIPNVPKECIVRESLGNQYSIGERPVNGSDLQNGIIVRMPPGSVKLLLAEIPQGKYAMHDISADRKALDTEIKSLRALNNFSFTPLKKDNVLVDWRVVDRYPEPALEVNEMILAFDSHKAAPNSWVQPIRWGNPLKIRYYYDFLQYETRGILGALELLEGGRRLNLTDFQLKEVEIVNGLPQIEFEYTVPAYNGPAVFVEPLEGLTVHVKWTLDKTGKKLTHQITLKNSRKQSETMKCALKIQIYPRLGKTYGEKPNIADIGSICYRADGKEQQHGIKSKSIVCYKNNVPRPFELSPKDVVDGGGWDGKNIVLRAEWKTRYSTLTIEPDSKMTGFYSWWGASDYTAELISKEFILPCGKEISLSNTYTILFR